MNQHKKGNKIKVKSIFIIPSPPTLTLPAKFNVWRAMKEIFNTVYIIVQEENEWTIRINKNHTESHIQMKIKYKSSKHKQMLEFLALIGLLKLRKNIDVVLLYQCGYSALISLFVRILGKKVVVFLGGSRWDVIKANMTYSPSGIYQTIRLLPFDIGLSFLTLLLSHKVILVTSLISNDQIVSLFKYKIFIAYNLPSDDLFHKFKPLIEI